MITALLHLYQQELYLHLVRYSTQAFNQFKNAFRALYVKTEGEIGNLFSEMDIFLGKDVNEQRSMEKGKKRKAVQPYREIRHVNYIEPLKLDCPRMRMKWRSQCTDGREDFNGKIGCNTFQILGSTIPETQNSIRRLSANRTTTRIQAHRALQSRHHARKKIIPCLF